MPSREREERKMEWLGKWKRAWRRQTGEFWLVVYRAHRRMRWVYSRYGGWLRIATIGVLVGVSGYAAPRLQRPLAPLLEANSPPPKPSAGFRALY